jgi:hypothetical protein
VRRDPGRANRRRGAVRYRRALRAGRGRGADPGASGRRDRHRLDRGGNLQLNRALRVIAITHGRIDPSTRVYLARKEAEGKSRIEAMRCFKRHLARHYHRLLLRDMRIESATASG